jgi:hypothetical protein
MTAPDAGDVRGFYAALGIELPAWAHEEAPVRCFAQPDAHAHGDRSPSCSVNLVSGAWNCHGCGAHGGAYDAALARGHAPRSAIDLMIAYGLAERRASSDNARWNGRPVVHPRPVAMPLKAPRSQLRADDADVQSWMAALDADGALAYRLARDRAWSYRAVRELEVGFDGARITVPIRSSAGRLRGVLRYDPFGRRAPKMRAVPGTRLGLIPHPSRESERNVLLVEGPPDMIAARSCGLPAIAVPGTHAWRAEWSELLVGRNVTLVMDCDEAGRTAADVIAISLARVAASVEIVDLWPDRDDGYDLTDRILERRRLHARATRVPRTLRGLLAPPPSRRPRRAAPNPHDRSPRRAL